MGRPINKRYFGATGGADANIPIRFHDGSNADVEGYILSQRGTNKFNCSNDAGSATAICRLVNKLEGLAAGECSLVGITDGGDAVVLKKMFNRTAVDWNSNRYTWEAQDDSTESLIRLTAI
jgi:hypothetical protein